MTAIIKISRSINDRLGNDIKIILPKPNNIKIDIFQSKGNIIKSVEKICESVYNHNESVKNKSELVKNKSELKNRYMNNKKEKIYKMTGIMKGKFFYDESNQRYIVNPNGWWVSEKLDGIRAIWTGQELMSRNGNKIYAPEWFIKDFPQDITLDGELYIGRNRFNLTQTVVMDRHMSRVGWEKVKYYVFDVPDATNLVYEEVQILLREEIKEKTESKYLRVIEQTKIQDLDHLLEKQKELVKEGAEGTMLRQPNSKYYVGLTSSLLKFKTQMDKTNDERTGETKMVHLLDDIGIITGYKYDYNKKTDDGKNYKIQSIMVKWIDKKKYNLDPEFTVSSCITQSQKKGDYQILFPIGQKVKILYNQLFDSQKPRFPRYVGWYLEE